MYDDPGFSSNLPPYSGDAQCPKCTSYGVGTTWHLLGLQEGFPCEDNTGLIDGHLCRVCPRCRYGWIEATADTSEDAGLRSLPGGAGQ